MILWGWKDLKAEDLFNIWFGWCDLGHTVWQRTGTSSQRKTEEETETERDNDIISIKSKTQTKKMRIYMTLSKWVSVRKSTHTVSLLILSKCGSVFLLVITFEVNSLYFPKLHLKACFFSGVHRYPGKVKDVPRVSQGSFFQEQMSSPVRRMAWSWRRPSLPPRVDCQWQKLFSVWSAWWLITKPSCDIKEIEGEGGRGGQLGLHRGKWREVN